MKVGSFRQEQEPNRNRFTEGQVFPVRPKRMATAMTGAPSWRGRVLEKADLLGRAQPVQGVYSSDL